MILLCRFYDNVGVYYYYYYSGLRGPTDEEIIVIEKRVSYSKFQGGGMLYQHSHTGKQQGLAWRQREGGERVRSRCLCGFCRKGWVRKGKQF